MTEVSLTSSRLLAFARRLQDTKKFGELLAVAGAEAKEALRFEHVWFMLADDEEATELRLIEISSAHEELAWQVAPTLKVEGDAFLKAILASDAPVVIEDARLDPRTNKQIVEQMQNRTLINVPLRLLEKPLGVFGLGTFGDEGCRGITDDELSYLVGMASQITVAASRIRFLEDQERTRRERLELERRLAQVQRLESLGTLAGGIAHDFNNLLTVILSSAGIAEELTTEKEALEEIRAVLSAGKRASDLTRQLLAMSREQELALKPLDLNAQLSELLELARRIVPENIRFDFIGGQSLPLIEGDPSQLDQVFMNLFVNARDAMANGGRLMIETEQVLINGRYTETHPWARPGRYVLTTVTDSGTGMPKEVSERVFEPFFTTKDARRGTGLGLAVAYGIVRQHRGMMHCYSEVGVGTTFKVYLPALERLASNVGSKLEALPVVGEERILVAEDDELVRAVAVRILERAGYRVTTAEDGEAACGRVAREEFELVVLDVVMPGMPCRTLIDRIRTLRPRLRILLSSGYTAGANVATLTELTGSEILSKPYDPDQMLLAVRRALDRPT